MMYLSIDFETTGLIAGRHAPLEFAAILDNGSAINELPRFHCVFDWDEILIQKPAAKINLGLMTRMLNGTIPDLVKPENFKDMFTAWLIGLNFNPIKDRLNLAAKNPSFDASYLRALGVTCFRHRFLDPAQTFLREGDSKLPDLKECLERAGIVGLSLHEAMDDALAIVMLLRHTMFKDWLVRAKEF